MQNNGISTVFTILILMAVGLLMKKNKVMNSNSEKSVAKIIQSYCIPALMLYNVTGQFTKDFLIKYRLSLIAVLISYAILLILSFISVKLFSIDKDRMGVFAAMFSFSNTIFIGVPIITGVFGEKGIPYLMLYYLVNTFCFWSIGIYLIGMDKGRKFLSKESIKKFLNPGIISFFIGIFLLYNNISLPSPLMKAAGYMASMVTPLSTVYMGSVIADLSLSNLKYVKDTVLVLLGRFIVAPFVTLMIMKYFAFDASITRVFVIASSLPVMTNVSVSAGFYGKDEKYAAFMTTLTTVLYIFVLPLYFNFI